MNCLPTGDPMVLERILELQNASTDTADPKYLMVNLTKSLLTIPGVQECIVGLPDCTASFRRDSESPQYFDGSEPFGVEKAPDESWQRLEIRTARQTYGSLFLDVQHSGDLTPYRLLIDHLANLFALQYENCLLASQCDRQDTRLAHQFREQAQQLLQSESRLREAQRVAGLGSFEGTLTKDEVWWSDELYHLFGLDPNKFVPTKEGFFVLLHPDDQEHYVVTLQRALESGETLELEYRAKHASGQWRHFETIANVTRDKNGTIDGLRGTVQEITHRKQAALALHESEKKYRTLVESSPYCIHQIDLNGQMLTMNRAGLEMLAQPDERAVVGLPYLDAVCPEDRDRISNLMDAAYAGEFAEFEFQGSGAAAYRSNFVPLRDSNGTVNRLLGITQDVTERKRAEQDKLTAQEQLLERQRLETEMVEVKLSELREQLVHRTRLATVGQMTSSVAHELRNPLGAVRNAAYYLKRHASSDNPKIVQYLEIIDQEIHAADRVIRNMLEMARSKTPIVESFDLCGLVRNIFERIDSVPTVRHLLESPSDPFTIVADRGLFQQVIVNLVTNAAQAAADEVEIRVELERTPAYNLIYVHDNGPGIAKEHRHRLFEPLYTTKAKGTGLGLTICKEIIERHGGTIELLKNTGSGASFCVKMPTLPASTPP